MGTSKGITKTQQLEITSEPAATLTVNDEDKGQTPLTITLPYTKSVINLEKNQYEKSLFSDPKVIDKQEKTEEIVQSASYMFKFQTAGYHDAIKLITVPQTPGSVHAQLDEKIGIIDNIECSIQVEARKEYFETIERTISMYAMQNNVKKIEDEPVQLEEHNIYRQTFNMIVKNSIEFDALVRALLFEAKQNHFVFNILDAYTKATFSTNVLKTGIDHIVQGRIRKGAVLYSIQNGRALEVKDIEENGQFYFKVRLSENERNVFLVSKYKDILVVYKKIDVFSQQETELIAEDFAKELGVTVEDLKQMIN